MPTDSPLSTKPIDPRDRLIFALDVPTLADARAWIDRLGDAVTFYKIGLEFCMSGDYFTLLSEPLALYLDAGRHAPENRTAAPDRRPIGRIRRRGAAARLRRLYRKPPERAD